MTLMDSIKTMFKKGKASMGMGNYLKSITDDERVALPPEEIQRIKKDLAYYKDDNKQDLHFYNVYNVPKTRHTSKMLVTKQASRQLASLVFNEGMEISIQEHVDEDTKEQPKENDTLDKYIKQVLGANNFNQLYEEYLETAIATGGFAIRPYVENNQIKLAWIRADQFIPLESNSSEITSAVIVSRRGVVENKKNVWYSLLEFHQYDEVSRSETITNEVYRSENDDEVGLQVDVSVWQENLQAQVIINDISRPTFAYFKMPGKNNVNIESPLGIGIVESSEDIINAANRAYDQYDREVQLAKRRVAIPGYMIKPSAIQEGNPNSGYPKFDEDEDTFIATRSNGESQTEGITAIDTTIRNVQYTATIQFQLHALENNIGLSQGTLTTDAAISDKTATEVVSDNSLTYRTRSSIITQCEKQLYGLIRSILELSNKNELFDGQKSPISYDINANPIDINLHFEDGVFVDKDAQAKQDLLLVESGLMPKKQFLMRNLGLSPDDAKEWLSDVQDEVPEADPVSSEQAGMLGGDDGE